MSGHSKWSTIKHKKGRADAARGKLFTKLIRELTVSTREGGKEAGGNPRLRSAIISARAANMPNDTIERAIKRGAGEEDGVVYEEATYEGYGPGGIAFIVETMTDNKNRTVAELRHILARRGGNLGTDGSVAWMFGVTGYLEVSSEGVEFEQVFEDAVEAGASDIEPGDDYFSIYCDLTELNEVNSALENTGYTIAACKRIRVPTITVSVTGKNAEVAVKLMELLDDQDDVQNVYTNADISDEEMSRLTS